MRDGRDRCSSPLLVAPAWASAQHGSRAPRDRRQQLPRRGGVQPGAGRHPAHQQLRALRRRGLVYSFTEEWPAPSQKHQLSVSLFLLAAGEHSGFGDVAINYRYQAKDGARDGIAFSPRLSVLFPTGDSEIGLGSGATGLQVNLPVSVHRSSRFVTHSNLGATWISHARAADGSTASTLGFNAGQSVIWFARPSFHPLVELAWTRLESVLGPDRTETADALYLSPGVRWAHNSRAACRSCPASRCPSGSVPAPATRGFSST